MKKIYILSILLCFFAGVSQEITTQDALRYAIDDITGTARFRSMSGAFGAVGGDLSAININPAGSAIFNHNIFSVSGSNFNTKNKSNYFNSKTNKTQSSLNLNQLGAVFVFTDNNSNNNWSKFTIALNYENTKNLDNNIFSLGTNPNNSIGYYFLDFAQGLPLEYLQLQNGETITDLYTYLGETSGLGFEAQQALLGYGSQFLNGSHPSGLLFEADDPNDLNNTSYYTNIPTGGNFYQENSIRSNGYNGKFTGNFATSYKNKLFLGLNLNAHFTDYVRTSRVTERNSNPLYDSGLTVERIQFNNELYTYGGGFSFDIGAIFQVSKELRIGLAHESSTWYNLNDELIQSLSTNTTDGITDYQSIIDPNVTNIYPAYKLKTPGKWTVSGAYIINKTGLISADVSRKDYSKTQFKPIRDYQGINRTMSEDLTEAYEVRIGGEYKIKQVSLRAGYRFEQSPYKIDYAMGDLTGYSGGIGYNFGISRLDLAYSNSHRNYNQRFVSSGMNDTARIRTIQNNVTLTYTINF